MNLGKNHIFAARLTPSTGKSINSTAVA